MTMKFRIENILFGYLWAIGIVAGVALIYIFGAFITGCSPLTGTTYRMPDGTVVTTTSVEETQEHCIIYRLLKNTWSYKAGFLIVNEEALTNQWYTPQEAIRELKFLRSGINRRDGAGNLTATVDSVVGDLIMVAGKAAKMGQPKLFVLTQSLTEYQGGVWKTTLLDECTAYKLTVYIEDQIRLCQMYIID